jgi:hypothetical protein
MHLPYELWLECMQWPILDSANSPLLYMSVSHQWENLLLESPSIFTTIVVNDGEDELARIHAFLHLSAGHPINVRITRVDADLNPEQRNFLYYIRGKRRKDSPYRLHAAEVALDSGQAERLRSPP